MVDQLEFPLLRVDEIVSFELHHVSSSLPQLAALLPSESADGVGALHESCSLQRYDSLFSENCRSYVSQVTVMKQCRKADLNREDTSKPHTDADYLHL